MCVIYHFTAEDFKITALNSTYEKLNDTKTKALYVI